LNQVTSNVRKLVQRRNVQGLPRLKIFIDMTLMRENIEELPEFVDLAAELGVDGVQLKPLLETDMHRSWKPVRGDWVFDYEAQLLGKFPELTERMIAEGRRRAKQRGVLLLFDTGRAMGSEGAS
jgi:hypothetical protein